MDGFLPGSKRNVARPIDKRLDDAVDDGSPLYVGPNKADLLKDEVTTVVGAMLAKQQCWERTACMLGKRTKSFAAKDVVFM